MAEHASLTGGPEGEGDDRVAALADALSRGERRALARALTLIESTRLDDRRRATALLDILAARRADAEADPASGGALRLALTGAPGVGKSTFIEAFGLMLAAAGERLGVLAIDPSSSLSGGSILGDKTRMELLSRRPEAFIRPSPARGDLGGVARRTREAIRLVEAWGATVVLVETVGVGQSETAAADMTDVFALLIGPAAGDELQGVKRGVMERADLVVVTKADGDLAAQAGATAADYAGALRLLRKRPYDPPDFPAACAVSAATGAGLDALWSQIRALDDWRRREGWRERRRAEQNVAWMRSEIERGLTAAFQAAPAVAEGLPALEAAAGRGALSPDAAAAAALALFAPAAAEAREER